MSETSAVSNWINTIAFSHSHSNNTPATYKPHLQRFLTHANITTEQILKDNETLTDKQFKRKYTPNKVTHRKTTKRTLCTRNNTETLNVTKSYFKYNSLPLNYLPTGRSYPMFQNRDITQQEIIEIIKSANPREQAYYTLMTQSGLRPNEISNLKIGDVENILQENTPTPCLITIRQEATKGKYHPYFTFTGKESIKYIKEYFKRTNRTSLTPEDYLFTMEDGKTKTYSDLISQLFRRTTEKLKKQTVIEFKNKKSEKTNRNELRLYNLRKYFRNNAGKAGEDYVNFWMGHSNGVDDHYFTQTDTEKHRKQYKELSMPYLTLETPISTETAEQIKTMEQKHQIEIEKRDKEISKMHERIEILEQLAYKINAQLEASTPEEQKTILRLKPKAQAKIEKEHPEWTLTDQEQKEFINQENQAAPRKSPNRKNVTQSQTEKDTE